MSGEDDDQPTVVLDFNAIKDQLSAEEELTQNPDELFDTQTILEAEGLESAISDEKPSKNVYLFNYQTDYFEKNVELFSGQENIFLIYNLEELNQTLKEDPESIIIFYYNSVPKAVNQLSGQIKAKFPATQTLIIAKGLSAEKAQKHHQSKYGATAYLNEPFEKNKLINTLEKLNDN